MYTIRRNDFVDSFNFGLALLLRLSFFGALLGSIYVCF